MWSFLKDIGRRHETLKQRIHNFRMPLSPFWRNVMGFVYFTIPILGGIQIMEWAKGRATVNLGPDHEKLHSSSSSGSLGHGSQGTLGQNMALQLYLDEHKKRQDGRK